MRIANKISVLALGLAAAASWSSATLAQSDNPPARSEASAGKERAMLSSVSSADRKFYVKLAESNLAEIASSKQALAKSNDDQIKSFAQHMVDDHGAALEELSALARDKQVELPSVPDEKHRKQAERMADMSAIDFNNHYAQAAVVDHRATLKLLDKIIADAKDQDLKAFASKMKPKVQAHLKAALELKAPAR